MAAPAPVLGAGAPVPPELFARTTVKWGGALSADKGMIGGSALPGVLMQNLAVQYAQAVSRIYELGQQGEVTRMYYVGGRAQGNLTCAHVVGPGIAMKTYYSTFTDVCNAGSNTISLNLSPNLCPKDPAVGRNDLDGFTGNVVGSINTLRYVARYCVLTQLGLNVAASDFVINQNSNIMFGALGFDEVAQGAGGGIVGQVLNALGL